MRMFQLSLTGERMGCDPDLIVFRDQEHFEHSEKNRPKASNKVIQANLENWSLI